MLPPQADKGKEEMSEAKRSALQDDILAVCRLHSFQATPTVQNQLQALDKEFHQLREQGQSSKADYVQTLYLWLSKQTAKVPPCSLLMEPNTNTDAEALHISSIQSNSIHFICLCLRTAARPPGTRRATSTEPC